MVWAELGASFPGAGGSYQYLKECFGPQRLGRLLSFLFVWQLSFSAPLSIASGCIGLSQYAAYRWPAAQKNFFVHDFGIASLRIAITGQTGIAIAACLLVTLLLYRRIGRIGWLSQWLWLGVIATLAWVIFTGFTHFDSARAFDFPPGAFHLGRPFLTGLGAALLVGAYDYWGYYNVCFLGGEVKDPTRNIPRALILSIVAVAAIYLAMNISILGVVPWRELDAAAKSNTNFYVVSLMMQRVYGSFAARIRSDYWGYYNVCFLGGEVKDPTRNIPRALILSIVAVAAIYLAMNISILGVVPWRELDAAAKSNTNFYVVSLMMQRVYGSFAARI